MECMTAPLTEPRPAPREEASTPQAPSEVTLFIGFGIGNSYIFYVGDDARDGAQADSEKKVTQKYWEEVFAGQNQEWWSCEQFKNYDKPLGWAVTLNVEGCASEKLAAAREKFLESLATNHQAEAVAGSLKAVFFTPGVAVLSARLLAADRLSYEALKKEPDEARRNMLAACRDLYNDCLKNAIKRNAEARGQDGEEKKPPEWTLELFDAVDKTHWGPPTGSAYPVYFYDKTTYAKTTEALLSQAAGTDAVRMRQADDARVSYSGSEVYVDWSETFVRAHGGGAAADAEQAATVREEIETAFTIGMASWFALYLMNKLASIYLLQTFVHTNADGEQSMTDAIHKKSMAYMDVANAAHPIRWTDRRRDLYLLETIHRNWSSDRWWKNIEQRMALLSLHYKRLEDQRRQLADEQRREADEQRRVAEEQRRTVEEQRQEVERRQEANTRRLTHVATALACGTFVSIVADATNLYKTQGLVVLVCALVVAIILVTLVLAYMKPGTQSADAAATKDLRVSATAVSQPPPDLKRRKAKEADGEQRRLHQR